MRLLSEISSARAAIAASYLNLWRGAGTVSGGQPDTPPSPVDAEDAPASAPPAKPREPEQA